jgi:hypothetical protein
MVQAFLSVTQRARPGDAVYVHYSGHGARAQTIFPHLKQSNAGLDEVFVPYNATEPGGRYLRDVEIAALLREMVNKGLVTTVVIDACHSASATRISLLPGIRGLTQIDGNVLKSDKSDLSPSQLEAVSSDEPLGDLRDAKRKHRWLIEPRGYTLLAACRAHEQAAECDFNGTYYGAFTCWLMDPLNLGWQVCTYQMLHNRVRAKVNARFKNQTPMLNGEGDRVFFGSNTIRPLCSTTVIAVTNPVEVGSILTLGSGKAQGIDIGSIFAIYESGEFDPFDPSARQAFVRVDDVNDISCNTVIAELTVPEGTAIRVGDNAVLTNSESPSQRKFVKLRHRPDAPKHINQQSSLFKLRQQLNCNTHPFIDMVEDDHSDQVDFQVMVNDLGEYEIYDASLMVIQDMVPSIRTADPLAAETLAGRLSHLAKYYNVWELDNPDRSCPLARALSVELVARRSRGDSKWKPFYNVESVPEVDDGDTIWVKIENLARDGVAINVTVLDLAPGWSISQIYPMKQGADFDTVEAGESIPLYFKMSIPNKTLSNHADVLKVFATVDATSFRWLELPKLGREQRCTVTRDPRGSLEEYLAAFNTTRLATPVSSGYNEWVTVAVMVKTRECVVKMHPWTFTRLHDHRRSR